MSRPLRSFALVLVLFSMHVPRGWSWGWVGHRLISRIAVSLLPPEARRLYEGKEAQLDAASVHPDQMSMINPDEALRHFVNVEVLMPGFAPVLQSLSPLPRPPGSRAAMPIDNRSGLQVPGLVAEEPNRHGKSGEDAMLKQRAQEFFRDKLPLDRETLRELFGQLPREYKDLRARFHSGQLAALGTVDYQPALCYRSLVRAMREKDIPDVIYWTGKMSHYIADAHQPLHNTVNHDGKISGNLYTTSGGPEHSVHSRFEAGLPKFMGARLEPAVRKALEPIQVVDVDRLTETMMAASQEAYTHIGELTAIDREYVSSHPPAPRMDWNAYYTAMEKKMGPIVCRQMGRATTLLGSVLVAAWREASVPKARPSPAARTPAPPRPVPPVIAPAVPAPAP